MNRVIYVILIFATVFLGTHIAWYYERMAIFKTHTEKEVDLRMELVRSKARERTCLYAFKDKVEYQYHNNRIRVKKGLGLTGKGGN